MTVTAIPRTVTATVKPAANPNWGALSISRGRTYFGTQKTAAAPWAQRDGARVEYFKGLWWLIAGWWPLSNPEWPTGAPPGVAPTTTNSVWSSPDLVNWTMRLAHDASPPTSGPTARFARRHTFQTFVHEGFLWVMGCDNETTTTDVWRSSDGVTWVRVAASSPWPAGLTVIPGYFQGRMHLMGGHDIGGAAPTRAMHWSSTDGVNWTHHTDMPFTRAAVTNAVVLDGRMYIIGGSEGNDDITRTLKNDTWAWDGNQWHQMSSTAIWEIGDWIASAAYDGRLWVLTRKTEPFNGGQFFYSEDCGVTWKLHATWPYPISHADGICVTDAGIAIVSGNGQGTCSYLIKRVADDASTATPAIDWALDFDGSGYNPQTLRVYGLPSAGVSASNDMIAGLAPTSGEINGRPTVLVTAGQSLQIDMDAHPVMSSAAWTFCWTGKINSATGVSDPEPNFNPALACSSNGFFSVSAKANGTIVAYLFVGSNQIAGPVSWVAGVLTHIQVKYDGTALSIRIGKGAWSTKTTSQATIAGAMKIGVNAAQNQSMNAEVCQVLSRPGALSDALLNSVSDEQRTKWGGAW